MTTPDALAALQRETGRAFVEISAPPGGQVSHATVVAREDGHRVCLQVVAAGVVTSPQDRAPQASPAGTSASSGWWRDQCRQLISAPSTITFAIR